MNLDYKQYRAYFENIAFNNVDIPHNPSGGNNAFFGINIEEVLTGLKSLTVEKDVNFILINYAYVPGQKGGEKLSEYDGGFLIIKKMDGGDYNDETEKRTDCEKICNEVIAKIKLESQTQSGDPNSFWYASQDGIYDWFVSAFGGVNNDYVGVQAFFKFKHHFDCTVDPNKWNDLTGAVDPHDWATAHNNS